MAKDTAQKLLREYWKVISKRFFGKSMEDLWVVFFPKVCKTAEIRNSPLYRTTKSVNKSDLDVYAEAFWAIQNSCVPKREYQGWNKIVTDFIDMQARSTLIGDVALKKSGAEEKFFILRKAIVEEMADWFQNPANNSEEKQRVIFATLLTSIYWFLFTANSANNETAFQVEHRHVLEHLEEMHLKGKGCEIDRTANFHNIIEIRRGNPILGESHVELTDESFKISVDGRISIPEGDAWNDCRGYLDAHADELTVLRNKIHEDLQRRNNGIFRNDRIVGVLSTNRYAEVDGKPIGEYKLYRTDYFTHRVLEALLEKLKDNIGINDLNDEKNSFRRTSLGVNVIVRIPRDEMIFLVRRGKNAAYNNAGMLYPSVVETIDLMHRDFLRDGINPIEAAISRGLEEELGIIDAWENNKKVAMYGRKQILVRSLFYTQRYRQDNVFAVVMLNADVSISRLDFLCNNVSTDYAFENDGRFVCIKDLPESIRKFIYDHYYEMIDRTHYCLLQYLALWETGAFA